MILVQRTFQAKVGQAQAVVELLKEASEQMPTVKGLITTALTGATDRVAAVMQFDSLAAYEAFEAESNNGAEFSDWFARLAERITGATVEIWKLEHGML